MKERNTILTRQYATPCGVLQLGSLGDSLCLCDWRVPGHSRRVDTRLCRMFHADMAEGTSPVLERAVGQLDEYFAGRRRTFDVPLLFAGTDFQQKVWRALLDIPYGTTVSYADLSARIGMPRAVRAVANANGANAISIFAPCHRVIGSDRSLTGYGGGLEAKRMLLELERAM